MYKLNVFDFDGTIYDGDSSVDFFWFCFRKNKKIAKYIPRIVAKTIDFKVGKINSTEYKEIFFEFLKEIENVKELVKEFWKKKEKKIKPVLEEKLKNQKDVVIISASPEFLLQRIVEKYEKVTLIATKIDEKTGKIEGNNCSEEEKIKRLEKQYGEYKIVEFYSDSKKDQVLAEISEKPYIVVKNKIMEWDKAYFGTKEELYSLKKETILNDLIVIAFIFSCPFFTLFVLNKCQAIWIFISFFLSLLIGIMIGDKYLFKHDFVNKKILISLPIALYVDKIIFGFNPKNMKSIQAIIRAIFNYDIAESSLSNLLSILAIPALMILVYMFIDKIIPIMKKEWKALEKLEKRYILVTVIIGFVVVIGIGCLTNVFYKPVITQGTVFYDAVYTTDTGSIITNDAFCNINHAENDIRQPLFGVFALPFGIIGHAISELLFFLPEYIAYGTAMAWIQVSLISVILVMLTKILKVERKNKVCFYLFFLVSAPYLIFSLCIEQYVIGLFYLILAIYIYTCKKVKVNYTYIGAVGTLITSGIIFPVITKTELKPTGKAIKQWLKDVFKCFVAFLSITICSGQLPQFVTLEILLKRLNKFGGTVSFIDRVYQYSNFVKSTLFMPESVFYYCLLRAKRVDSVVIIGVVILLVAIISFIMNRKDKFAKICFGWVLFSILILVVIGWGASENGMFLYGLYFSWAYLSLIYMLIRKICKKSEHLNIAMIMIIVSVLAYNIPQFMKILSWGIQYY